MRPAKLRGFRGAVQSGDETVGETTAGKNVFEEPVNSSIIFWRGFLKPILGFAMRILPYSKCYAADF